MATVSRASQSDKLGEVPDDQIKLGLTTTVIGYSATTMAVISTKSRCVKNELYVQMAPDDPDTEPPLDAKMRKLGVA